MDVILRGLVSSAHPNDLKREIVRRLCGSFPNLPTPDAAAVLQWADESLALDNPLARELAETVARALLSAHPLAWRSHMSAEWVRVTLGAALANVGDGSSENAGDSQSIPPAVSRALERIATLFGVAIDVGALSPLPPNSEVFAHALRECFGRCLAAGWAWSAAQRSVMPRVATLCIDALPDAYAVFAVRWVSGTPASTPSSHTADAHVDALTSLWLSRPETLLRSLDELLLCLLDPASAPSSHLASIMASVPIGAVATASAAAVARGFLSDETLTSVFVRATTWVSLPSARVSFRVAHWVHALFEAAVRARRLSLAFTLARRLSRQCLAVVDGALTTGLAHVGPAAAVLAACFLASHQHAPDAYHIAAPLLARIFASVGRIALVPKSVEMGEEAWASLAASSVESAAPFAYGLLLVSSWTCVALFPGHAVAHASLMAAMTSGGGGSGEGGAGGDEHGDIGVRIDEMLARFSLVSGATPSNALHARASGLLNTGNTCYLNSVLQAMRASLPFRRRVFSFAASASHAEVSLCQSALARMCFTSRHALTPGEIEDKGQPQWFARGSQQDCAELFRFVLDRIDVETGSRDDGWAPNAVFRGDLTNVVQCGSCGAVSRTREAFHDLALGLGTDESPVASIEAALDCFVAEEKVGEGYRCDACSRTDAPAIRRVLVARAPECLAVTLKRFAYDGGGSRRKLLQSVRYNETLCLRVTGAPVASGRGAASERDVGESVRGDPSEHREGDPSECSVAPSCAGDGTAEGVARYSLYAVLVHVGSSLEYGHYTCHARGEDGQWRHYDDSRVSASSPTAALDASVRSPTDTPYMLFYAREDAHPLGNWSARLQFSDSALREAAVVYADNALHLKELEDGEGDAAPSTSAGGQAFGGRSAGTDYPDAPPSPDGNSGLGTGRYVM